MSPNRDTPTPKKRESRAGTRKVTSLSAEQLERKRANDREAQRTIRERTKKHIDNLEQQVAELRAKGEHYDDVVRRNAALQDEIKRLRHELAIISGRQGGYSDSHPTYNSPSGPTLPPQLPGPLAIHSASRAPSALSTPSLAPDWQQYGSARSPSLCESTEADYPNRVESYMLEGQLQAPQMPPQPPPSIPVAPPQMSGFNAPGGSRLPDPAAPPYSHFYAASNPHPPHGDALQQHNPPSAMAYAAGPRTMPDTSVPSEKGAGEYPVFQTTQQQQYHPAMNRPQGNQPQYNYPWYNQS